MIKLKDKSQGRGGADDYWSEDYDQSQNCAKGERIAEIRAKVHLLIASLPLFLEPMYSTKFKINHSASLPHVFFFSQILTLCFLIRYVLALGKIPRFTFLIWLQYNTSLQEQEENVEMGMSQCSSKTVVIPLMIIINHSFLRVYVLVLVFGSLCFLCPCVFASVVLKRV